MVKIASWLGKMSGKSDFTDWVGVKHTNENAIAEDRSDRQTVLDRATNVQDCLRAFHNARCTNLMNLSSIIPGLHTIRCNVQAVPAQLTQSRT